MRLIWRPWKGCQFWDVPFTIPWKGCKFQKWGLRIWGYRIFLVFNMLHMLPYDHQVGAGVRGGGGILTFLTSTSFTLRKMHTLRMLSYDHQVGVPSSSVLIADGARGFAASCDKDYHHKRFKMAQVNHKEHIFTKTYHFPGRLRGKSYRTIVAGTQQMDGIWKHLKKWRPPSMFHKKNKHLGLQLDMASQRCLVADCGFWFATSALAPLASRRGKNWKSECRPDMIRVIENHRFQTFFLTLEEQNRVTAQAKRKFPLLSHTPANRNECPCCKHFLTTPANISILSLTLKNQNFKFVTLIRAPSQPVALFIPQSYPKK